MIACLQGITIIALQATIAYYNTAQVNRGLETDAIQSYDLDDSEQEAITDAIERLRRIKWENIAFIGFQFWFVGMSFDAVSKASRILHRRTSLISPMIDSLSKRCRSHCPRCHEFCLCHLWCLGGH